MLTPSRRLRTRRDALPIPEDALPIPEDAVPVPEDAVPVPEDAVLVREDTPRACRASPTELDDALGSPFSEQRDAGATGLSGYDLNQELG